MLFSSHQLDLVERVSDRVVVIDAGRVVEDGPVTPGLRQRFLARVGTPHERGDAALEVATP